MRLKLSVSSSQVKVPEDIKVLRRWVKSAIAGSGLAVEDFSIHLEFLSAPKQRAINKAYRGKDYATNVLTFVMSESSADILICPSVVRKEAREQGKAKTAHLAHLVIHGTLHALGFDHEKASQARKMEAMEIEVLAGLGIVNPYL